MVAAVQTAGDLANWHPHVHALVSRGGWTGDWQWGPIAYVDENTAELLYRHKVMRMLQGEGLLTEEDTDGLRLTWGNGKVVVKLVERIIECRGFGALLKDGVMHVQAGAGIVADSDPQSEHEECVRKARAVLAAVEMADGLSASPRPESD